MAGVPPDYFSEDGQLWGNPLYRWEAHARDGYAWWLLRLRALLERVDIIRIDHFRGFEAYWEVPAGSKTAATGRWIPGPGPRVLPRHPQGDGLRAADRRGPRRDHARGRGAARRVRPARHARHAVRLRRGPGRGEAPAAPLRQQLHRVHRDARQRHDLRLVPFPGGGDHPAARGGRGGACVRPEVCEVRRAGDPLGPDPHAVRVGGRHGDRADAGHPRAGQPRPDELPRQGARGTGPGGTAPSRSTAASRTGWPS